MTRALALLVVALWIASCAQIIGVENTEEYSGGAGGIDASSGAGTGGAAGTGGTGGTASGGAAGTAGSAGAGGTPIPDASTDAQDAAQGDGAVPVEICNDIDDDGDGQTDEDLDGNPCPTGLLGVCADGTYQCVAGSGACAPNVTASAEMCNGLDDDCNGLVDDFEPVVDGGGMEAGIPDGGLYGPLDPNAPVLPDGAVWYPPTIDAGDAGDAGDASASVILPPLAEVGTTCWTGKLGACGYGRVECRGAQLVCTPFQPFPEAEVCDTIDNDCNGVIDDSSEVDNLDCDTGLLGECSIGLTSCSSGVSTCVQQIGATAEICNGLDDDCNGSTDEDGANTMCPRSYPSAQNVSIWSCVQGSCGIDTCSGSKYNSDGNIANGCEGNTCAAASFGATCGTATSIVMSPTSTSDTRGGALLSVSDQAWFRVEWGSHTAGDLSFFPQITLTSNPNGDYQMSVLSGTCGSTSPTSCPATGGTPQASNQVANALNITAWEMHYEAHVQTNCSSHANCSEDSAVPAPTYVRVQRTKITSSQSCAAFQIDVNR